MIDDRIDGGRAAWRVAVGAAIGLVVAFGPAFIASFGMYVKPISTEFGWSRTQVSAIYSLVSIIGAIGTPFLGFLLDRRGSRPVILVASIALPCALLILPLLPASYPMFLAAGAVLGLVSIISSPAPYVSLLPQWFSARLGRAVAIGMFGSGLGQFGLAMIHGHLLTALPWRFAWAIVAGIVAVVGVTSALVAARDRPAILAARRAGRMNDIIGVPLGVALRTATFWTAAVAFFLVQLVTAAMLTHLAPLLSDRGWGISDAAWLVGLIGIFSLVGRAMSGAVLDKYGFGLLGVIIFPMQAVGCLILASGAGGMAPLCAAACIGLAYGVEADMLPWMLRRTFGLRCFGRLYGIAFGVVQLGSVLGPLIMGVSFDRSGSYASGLVLLAVLSILAAVLVWIASRALPSVANTITDFQIREEKLI
ncbi:MFS transporter [Sphingomonas sp. GB1N7]|uniref:MFS transporter n=1 Tax=Parasphingomonas caseinilytica TaxID=3096158 RepID=UPI002FC69365